MENKNTRYPPKYSGKFPGAFGVHTGTLGLGNALLAGEFLFV